MSGVVTTAEANAARAIAQLSPLEYLERLKRRFDSAYHMAYKLSCENSRYSQRCEFPNKMVPAFVEAASRVFLNRELRGKTFYANLAELYRELYADMMTLLEAKDGQLAKLRWLEAADADRLGKFIRDMSSKTKQALMAMEERYKEVEEERSLGVVFKICDFKKFENTHLKKHPCS